MKLRQGDCKIDFVIDERRTHGSKDSAMVSEAFVQTFDTTLLSFDFPARSN